MERLSTGHLVNFEKIPLKTIGRNTWHKMTGTAFLGIETIFFVSQVASTKSECKGFLL